LMGLENCLFLHCRLTMWWSGAARVCIAKDLQNFGSDRARQSDNKTMALSVGEGK
jgi:hypothetical protein